jgi:CBS domain-containing protein
MTVAVAHIMNTKVIYAAPDHTIDHVRELMASKKIHALPVIGRNKKMLGIVTTADVARSIEDTAPVRHVMSDMVITVSATDPASEAARLMRQNNIHHLVVTDRDKAVGIVSTFDLLKLVEEKLQ